MSRMVPPSVRTKACSRILASWLAWMEATSTNAPAPSTSASTNSMAWVTRATMLRTCRTMASISMTVMVGCSDNSRLRKRFASGSRWKLVMCVVRKSANAAREKMMKKFGCRLSHSTSRRLATRAVMARPPMSKASSSPTLKP